jgi:hypothetical protein
MRVFAIALAICVAGATTTTSPTDAAPKGKPAPKKPAPPKPPEPPPSPEKVRADKLFDDGRRYLAAKEFALACTAFEQSQAVDPAIGTLLNIALCYETWGKTTAAYRWYLEAAKLAKSAADDREKGAQAKVVELEPKVPYLHVTVPADAEAATTFMLDGNEIDKAKLVEKQPVEPGKHIIVARVSNKPPRETVFEIKEGERKEITIDVPRPEVKLVVTGGQRKKGKFYGGIGMTVGGAALMGVAAYVSLVARQDYADAVDECPSLMCDSESAFDATQDARKKATLMTYVGAGGVALVGVGVWFLLTSRTPKVTERRVMSFAPSVGPDSVGFVIGGRL